MRVTTNMLLRQVLRDIRTNEERLYQTQTKIASGKEILKPSDDPAGIVNALSLRTELSSIDQYKENIDNALSWLESTSLTLTNIEDIVFEVINLGRQGETDLVSAEERKILANEVNQFLEETVQLANTRVQDKAIFGGTQTLSDPFIANYTGGEITSVTQNTAGIDGTIERLINRNQTIVINSKGGDVFQPGGPGASGDVFQAMIDLRDALRANNTAGISAQISILEQAFNRIIDENAIVGAKVRRIEIVKDQLERISLDGTGRLSEIEDIDIAKAAIDYEVQRNIYQAALATGARIIQPSLLDFLR